jgi:hypothetical protein
MTELEYKIEIEQTKKVSLWFGFALGLLVGFLLTNYWIFGPAN